MQHLSAIRIKNHKIISMNQFISATISQQALNFTAFMSEDDLRIGKRVGRQAIGNDLSRRIFHGNQIAPIKLSARCGYSGGQKRAALAKGRFSTAVNTQHTFGVKAPPIHRLRAVSGLSSGRNIV